jgi:hypothetical protein
MLRARCGAAIARAVYPDLVAGIYDPDEVASVGGVVRNHTGYDFQCQYVAVNRFGSPWTTSQVPL